MHVTDRSKTVVMLIDWDNLQICHSRDAPVPTLTFRP